MEKYLADHFMVRGINRFVPHAFSPKAFPDTDCPPHFYAHGNNPQYRHFGMLMRYMNRICELLSGGRQISHVAILYHGDADWAGGKCMFSQVPARELADCQIQYDFIPADVFTEEKYHTVLGKTLKIHRQEYRALIIPETTYVTARTAKAAAHLAKAGCSVFFVNSFPVGICHGNGTLAEGICEEEDEACLEALKNCQVVSVSELSEKMLQMADVRLSPKEPLIRVLHYENGSDLFYFVNEGSETYEGTVAVNCVGECYAYNAWDNRLERIGREDLCPERDCRETGGGKPGAAAGGKDGTRLKVYLEAGKSLIVLFDHADREPVRPVGWPEEAHREFEQSDEGLRLEERKGRILANGWRRSLCGAIEYPSFSEEKEVSLPDFVEREKPDFGGFVRYEKSFELTGAESASDKIILEITDAAEAVEVFVNGVSAGIQIVPAFRYDIAGLVKEGSNTLAIEVATTLERAVPTVTKVPGAVILPPANHCGITGEVRLYIR